jgi:hypothetical protein
VRVMLQVRHWVLRMLSISSHWCPRISYGFDKLSALVQEEALKGCCLHRTAILSCKLVLWNCSAQCAAAPGFNECIRCRGSGKRRVAPVCTYSHQCPLLGGNIPKVHIVCGTL